MKTLKFNSLLNGGVKCFLRHSSTESIKHVEKVIKPKSSTVDIQDVARHARLRDKWWDTNGEMRALHALNPLRVQFVRDGLANVGYENENPVYPLNGVKILDVGCGGGILAEPLARIGAQVTGIDASIELITTAKEHAAMDPNLNGRLDYVQSTLEEFSSTNSEEYDAVVASEILEHVADKKVFLECCVDKLKPYGSLFLTTLNKTLPSWLGGIIAAEYILKLVPIGTHDWNKFIPPDQTIRLLESYGCKTKLIHGMFYNPLNNEWSWTSSTLINYAIHAIKNKELN